MQPFRFPVPTAPSTFTYSYANASRVAVALGWSRIARCLCFGASLVVLNVGSSVSAQIDGDRFASLLHNSPFGMNPATPPTEPTLEFRGYVSEGEDTVFSLACPDDNGQFRSTWVGLSETYADYVVRSFDRVNDTVQVEYRGQTFTLKLKLNRAQLSAASENAVIAAKPTAGDQMASDPAVAEVRRRRALRQASQALGQL